MTAVWKTVRVFISSTFRDMHAERDHLVKVVFPRVRAWCETRRLHLVDIDLRWGVTKQEADNGKAIEICLKEIDGSQPFFVCILGNRYGWVPDELPPQEMYAFRGMQTDTHLSITHLEIIHATQSPVPRKDGKSESVCEHSFFYFRDPQCLPSPEDIAQPARAEFAEAFYEALPARERMLGELKHDIRTQYAATDHVFDYRGEWESQAENPEDAELVGRLTHLEAFGDRVEADLISGISAQFAEHIAGLAGETDPLAEERAFHYAFIENRTLVHVPRADVESALSTYVSNDSTRPLVLSGPPGSGKSAILAHWVKENVDLETGLVKRDGATLVLPRFIGASPSSTNIARLLGNLCEALRTKYDLQEEIEEEVPGQGPGQTTKRKIVQSMAVPADPLEVLKKWPKFLEAASAKNKVLVVIDAINQLDRTTDPTRLYWLPRELPANVKLIVSVLDHGDVSKEDYRPKPGEAPDWLNMLRRLKYPEVAVPELNDEVRKRIVRELPNVFCKSLDDAQIAALIDNDATKNPLFLTVALEELRVFGSFERLPERIASLPKAGAEGIEHAIESILVQVLDRLEAETARHTPGLVPVLFAYLASAREGLSEEELDPLLARKLPDVHERDRTGAMQVVLRQVRAYLMRKGTLIDFYHRSFWKAVRAKYLAPALARHTAHVEIAEYFHAQDWFAESLEAQRERAKRLPPTPRTANLRKITELPWQRLAAVGAWEKQGLTQAERSGDRSVSASSLRDCATEPDHIAIESLFTELDFLESKNEAGLVFDLVRDFSDAVRVLPNDRPQHRILRLLEEALRRDIHFIARHVHDYPQALFQCLWNSCWWYDCPDAAKHYVEPEGGWKETPPWNSVETHLFSLMEEWRRGKEIRELWNYWVRSLRPPSIHLGTSVRTILRGHEGGVLCVAYSPDGTQIVSGSADNTVRVWDSASGKELRCLEGHEDMVLSVAISPDGMQMASGAADNTIRIWDAVNGENIECIRNHKDFVWSVAYSPDSTMLASGSRDHTVRVWDLINRVESLCLNCHGGEVRQVAFSPTGTRLVSGSEDKTVRILDACSAEEVLCLHGHDGGVTGVAYSPDGTQVVSSSEDSTLRVWDTRSGLELLRLHGHEGSVERAAYSPDGARIISASHDKTVREWDAASGLELLCVHGHEEWVEGAAYSPEGTSFVTASFDGTARVWDACGGAKLRILCSNEATISTLAFAPDGTRFISGTSNGTLQTWDTDTGVGRKYQCGHEESVTCVAYSKDGKQTVSGSNDKTVRVWDSVSGEELRCLRGHEEMVSSVEISADGTRLLSSSIDNTVHVWNMSSGLELLCLDRYKGMVRHTAFSNGGKRIIICSDYCTVSIWDVKSGKCLRTSEDWEEFSAAMRQTGTDAQLHRFETAIALFNSTFAYFPAQLSHVTKHPSRRTWIGAEGNHLHLVVTDVDPSFELSNDIPF